MRLGLTKDRLVTQATWLWHSPDMAAEPVAEQLHITEDTFIRRINELLPPNDNQRQRLFDKGYDKDFDESLREILAKEGGQP